MPNVTTIYRQYINSITGEHACAHCGAPIYQGECEYTPDRQGEEPGYCSPLCAQQSLGAAVQIKRGMFRPDYAGILQDYIIDNA